MRHKAFFVGVCILLWILVCVLALIGIVYCAILASAPTGPIVASVSGISTGEKPVISIEGCVTLANENSLFIYDPTDRNVWIIGKDTQLISYNDSVKTAADVCPGMMVRVLAHDKIIQDIFPTPLHDVEYVETWGEYNAEVYEEGLSHYDGTIRSLLS